MHLSITQPDTSEHALRLLKGASSGLASPAAERIVTDDHLTTSFERGQRRAEWVWTAQRSGRVVARVAGYGGPEHAQPWIIDLVDIGTEADRVEITSRLLRRAADDLHARGVDTVEQIVFAPSGWRDDPPPVLTELLKASEAAGFSVLVTRRRFVWTPSQRVPDPGTTLTFEPVSGADDPAVIDAYRRTFAGSLDAHTQHGLRTKEPDELAAAEVADMAEYAGPMQGWRLAYDSGGELVGLVTGNPGTAVVIGYVGVVPEQRGHGYARQLLAWMTRWQAEQGAEKVIGETDDQNVPMAVAFEAAGYLQESARIDLVHPG